MTLERILAEQAMRREIISIVSGAPMAIQIAAHTLLEAQEDLAKAEAEVRRHRESIAAGVAAEKGEDGKPRYSNETARNAAIAMLMEESSDADAVEVLRHTVRMATIQLQYEQDRFSAARALARLLGYTDA